MAYIEDYLKGIKLDLESVDPKEGHELVKDSIYSQAKKIANIANHNRDFLIMMMDEFMTMMENEHDIVKMGEYDTWERISHEQLMKEFQLYLDYGLDAVELFDKWTNVAQYKNVR